MKDKNFKPAYKEFMTVIIKRIVKFTPDQIKATDVSSTKLVHDYFEKILKEMNDKEKKKKRLAKYPPLKIKKHHGEKH